MHIVFSAIWRIGLWGLLGGGALGGIYGTVFAPGYGTFYGLLFGGLVGGILGLIDGIVVGGVTRMFFKPPVDADNYRWRIVTISTLFAGAGAVIGFGTLFSFYDNTLLVLVPSIIAGIAAGYAARRYANHYTWQAMAKKKKKQGEAA